LVLEVGWRRRLYDLAPGTDPEFLAALAALLASDIGAEDLLIAYDAVAADARDMAAGGHVRAAAQLELIADQLAAEAARRGPALA
jgi:hypothetical protein